MNKSKNIMAVWKEFNPTAERSMRDDFQDKPSPLKEKIIAYLNHGKIVSAAPGRAADVFFGKSINQTLCILTDGEFSWSNTLGYYVEEYNLQIPKELEDKILNR